MTGVQTCALPIYVEKDPTKFCTYNEFKTGIYTLKEFCLLRAESISGQLDGTIGSTSDTQESDTLIDAGEMQINDMGSMGSTMGGDKDKFNSDIQKPQTDNNATEDNSSDDSNANDNNSSGNNGIPQMPGNFGGGQMQSQGQNTISDSSWIVIGVSVLVLALGLVLAFTFKRRK